MIELRSDVLARKFGLDRDLHRLAVAAAGLSCWGLIGFELCVRGSCLPCRSRGYLREWAGIEYDALGNLLSAGEVSRG